MHDVLSIAKTRGRLFELAVTLDIDIEWPIHEDVRHLIVLEQRFERAESDHVVGQFVRECSFFGLVKLHPFLGRNCRDEQRDLGPQPLTRNLRGGCWVDPLHQSGTDAVFQIVAPGEVGGLQPRWSL
jgi:hypothetical protein